MKTTTIKKVNFKTLHLEYLLALSEIDEGDGQLVRELISIYLETAPVLLAEISTAFRNFRFKAVREHATKLEFGSERIGARGLADLCRNLVADPLSNELEEVRDNLVLIQQEMILVERELNLVSSLFMTTASEAT